MEGKARVAPDPEVVRKFRRFREMRATTAVRDYLGLSFDEWDNQPADFCLWAEEFYRIDTKGKQ